MRGHGFDGEYLKYLKDKYGIKKLSDGGSRGLNGFDIMTSEAKLYDHFFAYIKKVTQIRIKSNICRPGSRRYPLQTAF